MSKRKRKVAYISLLLFYFILGIGYFSKTAYAADKILENCEEYDIGYGEFDLNREGNFVSVLYSANSMEVWSDDIQNEIEERIIAALQQKETKVDLTGLQVYTDDKTVLRDALEEVINSDYRYFYISGGYSYSYNPNTKEIITLYIRTDSKYSNSDGEWDLNKIQKDLNILSDAVEYAVSLVTDEMTDVEKSLILHDYLVSTSDYDYKNYMSGTIPKESYGVWGHLLMV